MIELVEPIRKVIPDVVNEWNNIKLPLFQQLVEQSFEDYFSGRQTQEKTKMIAPILDSIFYRHMRTILPSFSVAEEKGKDYIFNNLPLECKITIMEGYNWTGNGYTKTPWHLLFRFKVESNGIISKKFAMLANLDQCKTRWTEPADSANYSALRFLSEDLNLLIPIIGNVVNTTKTGKPGTYVLPQLI